MFAQEEMFLPLRWKLQISFVYVGRSRCCENLNEVLLAVNCSVSEPLFSLTVSYY
jgi:hypothetical protein